MAAFGADYPIVYTNLDPSIIQDYGVFNLHGDGLASEAIFIFDKEGKTVWKTVGEVYSATVPAETVIEKLDLATS